MYDQTAKVGDEINYFGVTMENRGGCNEQKTRITLQTL
jgi:hypothetical protein